MDGGVVCVDLQTLYNTQGYQRGEVLASGVGGGCADVMRRRGMRFAPGR